MTDSVINKNRAFWTVADQKVIKAWLEEHCIDATLVPVTASFTFANGACTTQQVPPRRGGKARPRRRVGTTRQDHLRCELAVPALR